MPQNRKIPTPMDLEKIIKRSHKRCQDLGIDKNIKQSLSILEGKELKKVIKKNNFFIEVAYPFMKLLYEFLEGTGFLVNLTDANGHIIEIIGDENVLKVAEEMGMHLGTDMSEKSSGTNSIGTALYEKRSIQMAKDQHYIKIYHTWTCACAPVRNTKSKIIGSINVTGFYDSVHPHTHGFVFTIAELIENELRNIENNIEMNHAIQFNETVSDAVDFGIISASRSGLLKTVNNKACEMFGYSREAFLEQNAINLFTNWQDILRTVKEEGLYTDDSIVIINRKKKKKFNLNIYPIRNVGNKISYVVIAIKEMSNIYKLVNRYSGKNAYYTFNDIVYKNFQIEELVEYCKTVAKTPSTIMIQGESGTGKEIFAQSIHNASRRKDEPFIAINCGAIPKNLIESELFGYEKGAFTNARAGGMPGKFELANKGTIFLDEIGEMPMDMQVNLLRVLQERQVNRIGGTKSINIDVRIIAATNRRLSEEVKKGNFREDLYYRLNVIPIFIPPLRERKDDIEKLVEYFLLEKSKVLGEEKKHIDHDTYKKLFQYNWPGNVRELENIIENYIINGILRLEIIETEKTNLDGMTSIDYKTGYAMQSLDDWEKIAIKTCIKKCNGNISKAASILGINRSTLYKKIKSYK